MAIAQVMPVSSPEVMVSQYSYSDSVQVLKALERAALLRNTQQNPDSILPILKKSLRSSMQTGYKKGIANSLLFLANYYNETGKFEKSRQYYYMTLLFAGRMFLPGDTMKLQKESASIKFQIALSYFNEEKYDTAARFLLNIVSSDPDKGKQQDFLANKSYILLARCFARTQMDSLALHYSRKAIQLCEKNRDTANLTEALIMMGITYFDRYNDLTTARSYMLRALEYAKTTGYAIGQAYTYLGEIYSRMDSTTMAIDCFKKAIQLSRDALNNSTYFSANGLLAKTYASNNQPELAEKHYLICIQEAAKVKRKLNLNNVYTNLAQIYAARHQHKKAYQYQLLAAKVTDELRKEEKKQAVNLEVKMHTARKDNALTQQQLLIVQQESGIKDRNMWIAATIGIILMLAGLLAGIYSWGRNKQKLQEKQIQIMQHEQEIIQLEAQMKGEELERNRIANELHDSIMVQFSVVKMNLGILPIKYGMLAGTPEYNNVVKQLDYATKQLRNTAHNLMPDMLAEKGLIDALHYFCRNLNIDEHLHIAFQHYGSFPHLPVEFELPLYRIIQELLQNVIKHSKATEVLIQAGCQEGILGITVEDNGIGFRDFEKNDHGIGIKKMRSQVIAMNGKVDISSVKGQGTAIQLEFDINTIKV